MSLIDPSTPEGFFHLRLGPYKMRLLEEGKSYFPAGPEPGLESYFEEPLATENENGIESDPATLTAKGMLEKLRADWASEGETLLFELSEPLEDMRRHIVMNKPPDEEEISDFVYPLF